MQAIRVHEGGDVVFEQVTLFHQFLRGRRDESEITLAALVAFFD